MANTSTIRRTVNISDAGIYELKFVNPLKGDVSVNMVFMDGSETISIVDSSNDFNITSYFKLPNKLTFPPEVVIDVRNVGDAMIADFYLEKIVVPETVEQYLLSKPHNYMLDGSIRIVSPIDIIKSSFTEMGYNYVGDWLSNVTYMVGDIVRAATFGVDGEYLPVYAIALQNNTSTSVQSNPSQWKILHNYEVKFKQVYEYSNGTEFVDSEENYLNFNGHYRKNFTEESVVEHVVKTLPSVNNNLLQNWLTSTDEKINVDDMGISTFVPVSRRSRKAYGYKEIQSPYYEEIANKLTHWGMMLNGENLESFNEKQNKKSNLRNYPSTYNDNTFLPTLRNRYNNYYLTDSVNNIDANIQLLYTDTLTSTNLTYRFMSGIQNNTLPFDVNLFYTQRNSYSNNIQLDVETVKSRLIAHTPTAFRYDSDYPVYAGEELYVGIGTSKFRMNPSVIQGNYIYTDRPYLTSNIQLLTLTKLSSNIYDSVDIHGLNTNDVVWDSDVTSGTYGYVPLFVKKLTDFSIELYTDALFNDAYVTIGSSINLSKFGVIHEGGILNPTTSRHKFELGLTPQNASNGYKHSIRESVLDALVTYGYVHRVYEDGVYKYYIQPIQFGEATIGANTITVAGTTITVLNVPAQYLTQVMEDLLNTSSLAKKYIPGTNINDLKHIYTVSKDVSYCLDVVATNNTLSSTNVLQPSLGYSFVTFDADNAPTILGSPYVDGDIYVMHTSLFSGTYSCKFMMFDDYITGADISTAEISVTGTNYIIKARDLNHYRNALYHSKNKNTFIHLPTKGIRDGQFLELDVQYYNMGTYSNWSDNLLSAFEYKRTHNSPLVSVISGDASSCFDGYSYCERFDELSKFELNASATLDVNKKKIICKNTNGAASMSFNLNGDFYEKFGVGVIIKPTILEPLSTMNVATIVSTIHLGGKVYIVESLLTDKMSLSIRDQSQATSSRFIFLELPFYGDMSDYRKVEFTMEYSKIGNKRNIVFTSGSKSKTYKLTSSATSAYRAIDFMVINGNPYFSTEQYMYCYNVTSSVDFDVSNSQNSESNNDYIYSLSPDGEFSDGIKKIFKLSNLKSSDKRNLVASIYPTPVNKFQLGVQNTSKLRSMYWNILQYSVLNNSPAEISYRQDSEGNLLDHLNSLPIDVAKSEYNNLCTKFFNTRLSNTSIPFSDDGKCYYYSNNTYNSGTVNYSQTVGPVYNLSTYEDNNFEDSTKMIPRLTRGYYVPRKLRENTSYPMYNIDGWNYPFTGPGLNEYYDELSVGRANLPTLSTLSKYLGGYSNVSHDYSYDNNSFKFYDVNTIINLRPTITNSANTMSGDYVSMGGNILDLFSSANRIVGSGLFTNNVTNVTNEVINTWLNDSDLYEVKFARGIQSIYSDGSDLTPNKQFYLNNIPTVANNLPMRMYNSYRNVLNLSYPPGSNVDELYVSTTKKNLQTNLSMINVVDEIARYDYVGLYMIDNGNYSIDINPTYLHNENGPVSYTSSMPYEVLFEDTYSQYITTNVLRYKVELVFSNKLNKWLTTNFYQYPSFELHRVVKQSILDSLPSKGNVHYHEIWDKNLFQSTGVDSSSKLIYDGVSDLLAPKLWNVHRDLCPIVAERQGAWYNYQIGKFIPWHDRPELNWLDEC